MPAQAFVTSPYAHPKAHIADCRLGLYRSDDPKPRRERVHHTMSHLLKVLSLA